MLCLSEFDEDVFSVNVYKIYYDVIVRAVTFDETIVHFALTDSMNIKLIIITFENLLLHCLRIEFPCLLHRKIFFYEMKLRK